MGKENKKKLHGPPETERLNHHKQDLMSPRGTENAGLWEDNTEVYVKKWIDYTNKYGIGYKLSNEGFGVYFNDNTKIVLMPDMESVFYV